MFWRRGVIRRILHLFDIENKDRRLKKPEKLLYFNKHINFVSFSLLTCFIAFGIDCFVWAGKIFTFIHSNSFFFFLNLTWKMTSSIQIHVNERILKVPSYFHFNLRVTVITPQIPSYFDVASNTCLCGRFDSLSYSIEFVFFQWFMWSLFIVDSTTPPHAVAILTHNSFYSIQLCYNT